MLRVGWGEGIGETANVELRLETQASEASILTRQTLIQEPPSQNSITVDKSTVEILWMGRYNAGMELPANASDRKFDLFLAELAVDGNVTRSLEVAGGLDRTHAYNKRKSDPEFALRWEKALDTFADRLEAEALRRAAEGVEEPIVHKGQVTFIQALDEHGQPIYDTILRKNSQGEEVAETIPRYVMDSNGGPRVLSVRKYSDQLLLAMLKAKRKDYRDNSKIELANAPGEAFRTEESPTQTARTIAFALALGLRNAEKQKESGEDLA